MLEIILSIVIATIISYVMAVFFFGGLFPSDWDMSQKKELVKIWLILIIIVGLLSKVSSQSLYTDAPIRKQLNSGLFMTYNPIKSKLEKPEIKYIVKTRYMPIYKDTCINPVAYAVTKLMPVFDPMAKYRNDALIPSYNANRGIINIATGAGKMYAGGGIVLTGIGMIVAGWQATTVQNNISVMNGRVNINTSIDRHWDSNIPLIISSGIISGIGTKLLIDYFKK